jgi:glycosyltransferase involved in cell wall biosynthesis
MSSRKQQLKELFINPARMDGQGNILWDQRVPGSGTVNLYDKFDFVLKKEKIPFDRSAYEAAANGKKIINWIIPEMGKSAGGHINIFRFVMMLQKAGFLNRIYIINPIAFHSSEECREFLRRNYVLDLDEIEVSIDVREMGFAHATIATSWQTAYTLRDFDNTVSKFYFVQDFEPCFFKVGSEYAFAENTYKFGFRGLTAGTWLKDKLHEEYGMRTDSFSFSYDDRLYTPGEKHDEVPRVFFYARPVTERRNFELGMLALNEITKRRPDTEVILAGWDVREYEIPFRHKALGSVRQDKLAELYAQCDMCLVLSGTNLSLLPLEVMASNSVAVCTRGANSEWLVSEENSVLVDFDPDDIADKICYYLEHKEELAGIRQRGRAFAQATSWEKEGEKVIAAVKEGIEEDEKNISSRW